MNNQEKDERVKKKSQKPFKRERRPKSRQHPYSQSWALTKLTFGWLNEMIWISKTTPWRQEMNYNLCDQDKVGSHKSRLQSAFKRRKGIESALLMAYSFELTLFCFANLITTIIVNISQHQNSKAGSLINDEVLYQNQPKLRQFFFHMCLSMLLTFLADTFYNYYLFRLERAGVASKAGFFALLLEKILKFSPMNSTAIKEGYIANLIQIDAEELGLYLEYIGLTISSLVNALVSFYFIVTSVGWGLSLSFLAIMLLVRVVYLLLFALTALINRNYLKAKDKRMSLFRNVLENVEFIKINSLEDYFCVQMYDLRESELKQLRYNAWLDAVFYMLAGLFEKCPSLVIILLLLAGFGDHKKISFTDYLFYLQLATTVNGNLTYFFEMVGLIVYTRVSLKRIDRFLKSPEVDLKAVRRGEKSENESFELKEGYSIEVNSGSFKWKFSNEETAGSGNSGKSNKKKASGTGLVRSSSAGRKTAEFSSEEKGADEAGKKSQYCLRGVNLKVEKGEKVVVLGKSCSGRSSLLYALIGEMIPLDQDSEVRLNGSVGYMSQGRWLLGMSIKDNITLGKEFIEAKMDEALRCSQLINDMESFQNGLDTLLGDNGDTISGGQRARVALARCFYQE